MSGRGNRDDGMFKWFRKCVPCFNPAKEQDDRTGRSGDGSRSGDGEDRTGRSGSDTPRTPRTIQRSEGSKGKNIASGSEEGDAAVIEEKLKRSHDRKGKGIAMGGGVVIGSNRGKRETSSNIAEETLKRKLDRKGKGIAVGGGVIGPNLAEAGFKVGTTKSERHRFGDVSSAVVQGNKVLEDFSQVEMGRTATFVGIYDGHGGYQAAEFVSGNLTRELMERIRDTKTMSADHLRDAFLRTDALWLEKVDAEFEGNQYIAGYGTCCLVGVFWRRTLYLANAGDSRAVIARAKEDNTAKFVAEPLTRDDNVKHLEVRKEVLALHPDEPGFVVQDAEGVFRIKGRIKVSKSIGDAYLKSARHNLNHIERFKLNSLVRDDNPAVSADPTTDTISIGPRDRFVIFASDGLWDMMSNEEAVRIVQEFPKEGIAERLVIEALTKKATDLRLDSYKYFPRLSRNFGGWSRAHDDISVVVIFFDHTIDQLAGESQEVFTKHSIRQGSVSSEGASNFTALDALDMPGLEGGDAVASSTGGGGNVASSTGGEGDVASSTGGEGDVASSTRGEGDVAS